MRKRNNQRQSRTSLELDESLKILSRIRRPEMNLKGTRSIPVVLSLDNLIAQIGQLLYTTRKVKYSDQILDIKINGQRLDPNIKLTVIVKKEEGVTSHTINGE